ncbi:hypothetical protein KBX18_11650, partial [Corynebacterium sp. CCUG 69979]|uniref:hypothetical protein n=1 Tax=Corynebacterium sp. CCUG 69979 TaxID=2823890 RepID=UPI00210BE294
MSQRDMNSWVHRVVAVAFAMVVLMLSAAVPAMAQDENTEDKNWMQRGQEECVAATDATGILQDLLDEGTISQDEYNDAVVSATGMTIGVKDEGVEKIKEKHSERWKEIEKEISENRGFWQRRGDNLKSALCWAVSPVNAGIEAVNNSPFWGDPIGKFVKSVMEGNTEALAATMTFWMNFSTTSVDVSANTQGVKNIVMGVSGFALIASFIYGGWRIASSRRVGLQEGVSELNDNMLRWLIFSIAVPAMVPGAMVASDALADAIMEQFGSTETLINLGGIEDEVYGPILTLILSFVVLAGSLVQMLALVTRVLLAPIAAGLTPLFAALSFSSAGRQGLNHLVAFLISIIAFKPVSALLYSVVLWNVSGTEDISGTQVIINALMIGIAGFSAPALVRAVVPAVAQAGGGGAAPMLGGAAGAMAGGLGMAGAVLRGSGSAVGALGKAGASGAQGGGKSLGSSSGGGESAAGSGVKGPVGPRGGGGASADGGPRG